MLSNLYLLKYNQYYNRLVKREESISAYTDYIVYAPDTNNTYNLTQVNFNPNDGIDTQQVVNTPAADYDYLIVINEEGEIDSRWFVIQAIRNLAGQYTLSLHRDLMADYYNEAISATCYIERAMVNYGNKLIYNSENLLTNQIKKREILLKDITGCPWIVGYIALDTPETSITSSTISVEAPVQSQYTYTEFQDYASRGLGKISSITYRVEGYSSAAPNPQTVYSYLFGKDNKYDKRDRTTEDSLTLYFRTSAIGSTQGPAQAITIQQEYIKKETTFIENTETYITAQTGNRAILSASEIEAALNQNGLLVKDKDGKSYRATLKAEGTETIELSSRAGALYENIIQLLKDTQTISYSENTNLSNMSGIYLTAEIETYSATVEEYTGASFTTSIKPTNKALKDAPYKMFCIPYPLDGNSGRTWIDKTNAEGEPEHTPYIPDKQAGLNFAIAIAKKLGTSLYDLQLLPYCPAREWTTAVNPTWGDGPIALTDEVLLSTTGTIEKVNDEIITPVIANGTLLTYALWCETSSMSFTINNPITVPTNAIDFKVEHETSFYRLNSPNYSGSFEFKATSNQGVDFFEVNCTYKPYSPYIHLAPNFKGLYGGDYNDARGLVCGGDFSLPTLGDAWEQYQINNKSYMESFNRQIENMEINYNIQRNQQKESAAINAITAGISGAASGGIAGSAGGPIGTAIGASIGLVGGAAASAYGATRDLVYASQLHSEATSYAQDQFNLSLQNIQALPYSLNRVGAYDINNKYFPFLEFYSCSEEEKAAITARIRYNSMAVGAIGTVEEYLQGEPTFIQAQLIRIESLADDYHTATAIAGELHKGIYI